MKKAIAAVLREESAPAIVIGILTTAFLLAAMSVAHSGAYEDSEPSNMDEVRALGPHGCSCGS